MEDRPHLRRSDGWDLVANDDDGSARLTLPAAARASGYIDFSGAEVVRLISLLGVVALQGAENMDALNAPLTGELIDELLKVAGEQLRAEAIIKEALGNRS